MSADSDLSTQDGAVAAPAGWHARSVLLGAALGAVVAGGLTAAGFLVLYRPAAATQPAAFSVRGHEVELRQQAAQPMRFETAQAVEGQPLPWVPMTARVAALESRTAPSQSPLEGRVERVVVGLGDKVKQGDHLLLVRSGDLATMLRELRADLATAQTKKALADRLRLLVETRAASENDLLVAQNELHEAQLAAKAADSRLKSLSVAEEGDNLYWVLAMRAGVVVQLDAVPGQHVGPGREKPVVTVSDLEEVLVLADVPQRDAAGLKAGTVAEIRQPGANLTSLRGVVETVAQVVDPERQTVPIRIRVANGAHQLRPNAFVEAQFTPEGNGRLVLVPTESVVTDGLNAVVFVEGRKGLFTRRAVTVGRQADGRTEVLAGLRAGERVVVRGALLLLNAIDLQG